jgi:hypothetical protein
MMRVASILMEVMMTQLLQLDNLTFHSAEKWTRVLTRRAAK